MGTLSIASLCPNKIGQLLNPPLGSDNRKRSARGKSLPIRCVLKRIYVRNLPDEALHHCGAVLWNLNSLSGPGAWWCWCKETFWSLNFMFLACNNEEFCNRHVLLLQNCVLDSIYCILPMKPSLS